MDASTVLEELSKKVCTGLFLCRGARSSEFSSITSKSKTDCSDPFADKVLMLLLLVLQLAVSLLLPVVSLLLALCSAPVGP